MSLQIKKEDGVVYDPVFLKILEDIPGGVTIRTKDSRIPTTIKEIKKGALLHADTTSLGLYDVIKSVRAIHPGVSGATILYVEPIDHLFKAGEYIFLQEATASTITRVSPTAIAIEEALLATGGQIASGAILYETSTAGTATALYGADAVLRDTIEIRKVGVETLLANIFAGAVVRGTVDESETPYFASDPDKLNLTARIRFA